MLRIENNLITHNYHGIYLIWCDNCTIANNTLFENNLGVNLISSENITLSHNLIYNISIGAVNLGDSKYVLISDNVIQDCEGGLGLMDVNNVVIRYNKISGSIFSVTLTYSSRCVIDKNDIFYNDYGLNIEYSNLNEVTNNMLYRNQFCGLELSFANENVIRNNTILFNVGFPILAHFKSKNNLIYHNNIFFNTEPANDFEGLNQWNNDYPIGGNFWFDHSGVDHFRGYGQNESGSDGISDRPYSNIRSDIPIQDRYPLLNPVPVITSLLLPPTEPLNVKIHSGVGYYNLTWTKPIYDGCSDSIRYHIYRGTNIENISIFKEIIPDNGKLYFNDSDIEKKTIYYYHITALNEHGEGPNSTIISAIPIKPIEPKQDKDESEAGFELNYRHLILLTIILLVILLILLKLSSRKKITHPINEKDKSKKINGKRL